MPSANEFPRLARDVRPRSNTAFLVESLVLLLFLAATLAVLTNVFASSMATSQEAARLSAATETAQNAAEEFSANPEAVAKGQAIGAGIAKNGTDRFDVACNVNVEKTQAGTLYMADIVVSDDEGVAYTLSASSYAQGGTR